MDTATDTTTGTDDTATTSPDNTQAEAKTFTQDEVNAMMAKQKTNVEHKFAKTYEGVDVEEYTNLKAEQEKTVRKEQIKKGEFEKIMEETATKHNAEKLALENKIHEHTINAPIINAAAKMGSIDPEQVRSLIKGDFRLGDSGEVEVVDKEGKARYNSEGLAFTVEDRVREFIDSNPHFQASTPSTTNTSTNHEATVTSELDITKLDMKNPDDRAKYAIHRKATGIV